MAYLFTIYVALPSLLLVVGVIMKRRNDIQAALDKRRRKYTVTFPTGMTAPMVRALLESITAALKPIPQDMGGTSTVVFEVRWTPKGLRHILRVNELDNGYIMQMLEAHIPGVTYDPVDTPEESTDMHPVYAMDIGMSDPSKPLSISDSDALVASILSSVPPLSDGEQVAYQVILSHARGLAAPPVSTRLLDKVFNGKQPPTDEEVKVMRERSVQSLLNTTLRVGVEAANKSRGEQLARGILKSIRQANSGWTYFKDRERAGHISTIFSHALTPPGKTAQLIVPEATALLGLPIGDPSVPGLTQGAARRLAATEAISSDGEWVLGYNDVHGREKRITLPKEFVNNHVAVVGSSGTGKTTFLANGVSQYAAAGLGVIVIDAGQDIAEQRLYYRALDSMPLSRANDVICINPAADADHPVSINILDQGLGMGAITIVKGVFESIYHDYQKGTVTVSEVIQHGLWTLIEAGTEEVPYTIIDLSALISPRNDRELQWAIQLIRGVKDPELKDFWARHSGAMKAFKTRERDEWDKYVAPTQRRLWQLAGRPELRYIFGQSKSSIRIRDVMQQNKILLASVGGMDDPEAASIAASMLTQLVWAVAQSNGRPANPNIMVLDEFQVSANVQGGLPDMLARARALNLGLILSTQYVTRDSISRELRGGLLNNTSTRIVFRSGGEEARAWSQEFGRKTVTDNDIGQLLKFHAVAQVMNTAGDRSPVTFKASKPPAETGLTKQLINMSRQRYGRPINDVRNEIQQRRQSFVKASSGASSKPVGSSVYNESDDE